MKMKITLLALIFSISSIKSFEMASLAAIGGIAKSVVDLYNATGDAASKKRTLELQSEDYQIALHAVKMNFYQCLSNNKKSEADTNGFPLACKSEIEEFEQLVGFEEANKQRLAFLNYTKPGSM